MLTHWSYVVLALTHQCDYLSMFTPRAAGVPSEGQDAGAGRGVAALWEIVGLTSERPGVAGETPTGTHRGQISGHGWMENNVGTRVVNYLWAHEYHKISNMKHTKSQNLNESRLVLQLFPNPLKPGVKLRMKMLLEQRRQAMLQLLLSDQHVYCLLRCDLY